MMKEIKRNQWSRFFKKFNASNQYRELNISIRDNKADKNVLLGGSPFMGLALEKKGRLIDGVQFVAARADYERVTQPILSIKQPDRIYIEKSADGGERRITVKSKDGTEASAELGNQIPDREQDLIRQIAYSIYEKRGRYHGNDADDWLKAEQKVQEVKESFV